MPPTGRRRRGPGATTAAPKRATPRRSRPPTGWRACQVVVPLGAIPARRAIGVAFKVDPDNRRPVDYPRRAELLDRLTKMLPGSMVGLLEQWQDGAIKLAITRHALALRRQMPELFSRGAYGPAWAELNVTAMPSGSP